MFNISGVELGIILLVALLLLGPQRLPEVARGLGKFLREFRRQTDDVRTMVEREFYQMDQDIQKAVEPAVSAVRESAEAPALKAAPDSSASGSSSAGEPPAAAQSAAASGEAFSSSDPSGTGELYDAEYHAAEANGLLPPSQETDPATGEGSLATPRVAALEGPASAQPSSSENQEPPPRAK